MEVLTPETRQRIYEAMHHFAETGHGDVRKLVGREGTWALRVGDWRVIYRPFGDVLEIGRVLHRSKAYR
jgi:mRNA-degrading endonuclease RelE of RelBE toxin-antitoxin system